MIPRHRDGSAGDANHGLIGSGYTRYRQPDPQIAAFILSALGGARTVLNVGAGAGSYEPVDRLVTAVEPSASMRAQRPAHLSAAIDAQAERLLGPGARRANSAWSFVEGSVCDRFVAALDRDLKDGSWDARHGHLRAQPTFEGSLKLIVGKA